MNFALGVVGLIPMTSGSASVNGYDVHTRIEDVRRQLSICPQDRAWISETCPLEGGEGVLKCYVLLRRLGGQGWKKPTRTPQVPFNRDLVVWYSRG